MDLPAPVWSLFPVVFRYTGGGGGFPQPCSVLPRVGEYVIPVDGTPGLVCAVVYKPTSHGSFNGLMPCVYLRPPTPAEAEALAGLDAPPAQPPGVSSRRGRPRAAAPDRPSA